MKLQFAPAALRDLEWYTDYYQAVFPDGRHNAERQFAKAIELLLVNPGAGRPSETDGVRELPLLRTPFLIVYRVRRSTLEILRIFDGRRQVPESWN